MSIDNIEVTAASLDKYGEEDFFSLIVRYGLYIGAIFQFACISAAVLMSGSDSTDSAEDEARLDEPTSGNSNVVRRLHKIRKLDKKKRR